ncbi:MAG: glycosyltransferase family 2 protein [Lachnospiraceae bacterium]
MIVNVIIPSYKPDHTFCNLIKSLQNQSIKIEKIIIINTEEESFQNVAKEDIFFGLFDDIFIHHITKEEFDHGNTRNLGISYSKCDIVICMTQDVELVEDTTIETLIKPFEDESIAISYARQLPRETCDLLESYTRSFNYPEKSCIKSKEDLKELGIKTYFSSNVCAAYKKDVFDELGGFIHKTIFNEDMIYASKAINAGYKIAYVAEARVIHSHSYTYLEQVKRNFDLGVSQADNKEVFCNISSESEGIKLVKKSIRFLVEQKQKRKIPSLMINSACKFLGYKLGISYKHLPRWLILKITLNKQYWK